MPRSPAADKAYHRERYHRLRAERKCVDCSTELEPTDGVRCESCREDSNDRAALSHRRPEIRENVRAYQRRRYHKDPRAGAARMREYRERQAALGRCQQCTLPSEPGKLKCSLHLEQARVHHENYRRRKDAKARALKRHPKPKKPPGTGRTRPMRDVADPRELAAYVPLDEQLAGLTGRVLRAMRFRGWSEAREILDHLGIGDHEHEQYDHTLHVLLRLTRSGRAERRRQLGWYEYRLTDAGRAEADRFRNLKPATRKAA